MLWSKSSGYTHSATTQVLTVPLLLSYSILFIFPIYVRTNLNIHYYIYFIRSLHRLADIDAQDEHGWTSLHFSAWGGYSKCTKLLLQNGADRSIRDNNKRKAIDIARYREDYGTLFAILMLDSN